MTLPSSGSLTTTQIAAEVGSPFDIPGTAIRNLTGRAAGSITMPADFYGQTGGGLCTEGSTGTDTGAPTCVVAGLSFGATAWNRRIFACVHWACNTGATESLVTSATIGGIAASIHVRTGEGGTSAFSNYGCAIISATVPTGTSGSVSCTFDNALVRTMLVTTYRVTGLLTAAASDSGIGFDETPAAGTASASANLNISGAATGFAFFAATASADISIGNMTTTGITERQEQALAPDGRISNGFQTGLPGATPRSVSTSCAVNSAGRLRLVTASFILR